MAIQPLFKSKRKKSLLILSLSFKLIFLPFGLQLLLPRNMLRVRATCCMFSVSVVEIFQGTYYLDESQYLKATDI